MTDDSRISAAQLDDQHWAVLASAVWQLERSWRAGHGADLAQYVPPPDEPLRPRVLVELIKVDQEYRWESGDRKMLEAYLEDWPELADEPEFVTELLEAECITRSCTDTTPDVEEIRSRFPDISD